ncbi:hypothetical protein [Maribacter dokdonensis]|uniref:hypothetical protein n=1 Tax=Maribacter dokdonensis TaxID=320912 RepID=UPI0007199A93|nr:hypothetical protein [Maribacter dokdonensis]
MKLKRILIIVVSVFALIVAGGYFLLTKFLKAAGEECDVKIIAKINEYEVQDKSCIGFAGPRYTTYYIYKNGLNIGTGKKLDSCSIRFRPNHLILDFNICSNELKQSKMGIENQDLEK